MKTNACPCCGHPTNAMPVEKLAAVVSPLLAEMVGLLIKSPGEFVRTDRIADHIWRRDPNVGPVNFGVCISSLIARNRQRLHAIGWDVQSRIGSPGGYRIVILPEVAA